VTLGIFALLSGGAGEALLFLPEWRIVGATLLLAAMLAAGGAWGSTRERPLFAPHAPSGVGRIGGQRGLALRMVGIVGSLLLCLGGVLAWFASPGEVFGLQGVLWLASMALLVVACARWHLHGSIAVVGPPWTRGEVLAFGGLIILALFTYCAWLNDIPWRFHYDEAIAYTEAMRFYKGPPISVFTTTWHGTSLPSMPFLFSGSLMHIVGTGLSGVRMGVALLGALTVVPIYALGRLLAGKVAAILAAFAWATSAVAVHYSRVSIVNMTTPFFWAVCFYYLFKGLQSRRPADFAWAGLAAGLSIYTFYGTRLLPYLLVAFVAYLAVFHFREARALAGHLALTGVGFVVGFGPLFAYFIKYPDMWAGRGLTRMNVPPVIPTTWEQLVADWNILSPLVWNNFLSLSVIRSRDNFYWGPFLTPPAALLVLLGVGVLAWRWRQPGAFLLLLWGTSVVFVGGTLVAQEHIPAFVHWTPAFPAFFLALALLPALWLRALRRLGHRWWLAGCVLIGIAMSGMALANSYYYLAAYPAQVPPSFEAAQGRFLATLDANDRVRFVGNSRQTFYSEIRDMMAPQVEASDFLNLSRALPLVGDPSRDLLFVFNTTDQAQYLPLVQEYYPGGREEPMYTPGGSVGMTYRLLAAQAVGRYGALLTLNPDRPSGTTWQARVPSVGALPNIEITYPVTATWSGAFFTEGALPLRFFVEGASGSALWVQGERVAPGATVTLDKGWVPFSIEVRLDGPRDIRLLLQEGGDVAAEVESTRLWPQPPDQGLAATLNGTSIIHRIDPFVGSSVLRSDSALDTGFPIPLPGERDPDLIPLAPLTGGGDLIRWEGEVYAEGGLYSMELRTDAHARLALDGVVELDLCDNRPVTPDSFFGGDFQGVTTTLTLREGWHKVRLDLDATGNLNGLEWTWTRPGGVREIVPPSRLRHTQGEWPDPPTKISCLP
jgi:4-amino-4-deoxy-L-arabinose transferase-like glycosyltransferase